MEKDMMHSGEYSHTVTRAAFEAETIDELLDLLVSSPLAIPGSQCAAVIDARSQEKPVISHYKYLPREISGTELSFAQVLELGRTDNPAIYDPSESQLAASIFAHASPQERTVIAPLRLRGSFYGLLMLSIRGASAFADDKWDLLTAVIAFAISRLLHDGGGHSDGRKTQFDARLTDRQLQVCDLAIRGLSNRDIAHELHLSLGTVKVELGKIYRKLEIASRSHLYIPKNESAQPL
jgi:DNA-binding CsgD family transcriptional regulator